MAVFSSLSAAQARRIALAAQGFARPRPTGGVDRRHGRRLMDDVAAIQIDSVNVLCRSQELPLLARLGSHPRDLIARMTTARELFEYWGHEASHLPVALHPLLRWRMHDAREGTGTWGRIATVARDHRPMVDRILAQVHRDGAVTTRDIVDAGPRPSGMWGWSPGKRALEYLFWSGLLTARRGRNFERIYDLPERMLPAGVLAMPTPSREDAQRELLLIAARALGVATTSDLADYFRLNVPTGRALVRDLAAAGALQQVTIEGWSEPAYLHPQARAPLRIDARALLSPFDSLIWNRPRTERLWGMYHRLEIYVPRERRIWGYYVLPFLLDEALVARVDVKADRAERVLLVRAAHAEPGVDRDTVAHELAEHLRELADFLALDQIHVGPAGDLAAALGGAVAASSGAVARRVLDQVETQTPRLVKIDVADRLLAGGVGVDQHADAPVE